MKKEHDVAKVRMSFAQKRLWLHQQMDPNEPFYNNIAVFELKGDVCPVILENAINQIILRHETLRTTYLEEKGQLFQVVHPYKKINLELTDLSSLDKDKDNIILSLIKREARMPIDLIKGPIIRVRIFRLSEDRFMFLTNIHHIASDGWSWSIYLDELIKLYEAKLTKMPLILPKLTTQYTDYSEWQYNRCQSNQVKQQLIYWQNQLKNLPILKLNHRKRPAIQSFKGAKEKVFLQAAFINKLKSVQRYAYVSPFIYLLSVFQILLYRYSNQCDFGVGVPIANRMHLDGEKLIGYFVNTLVIRANIKDDMSFKDYLTDVRDIALDAYDNQELQFDKLVESIEFARDPRYNPLFQVMFVLQDIKFPHEMDTRLGFTISYKEIDFETSVFDMLFEIRETQDDMMVVHLNYNSDIFSSKDARLILRHYVVFLEAVINDPGIKIKQICKLIDIEHHIGNFKDVCYSDITKVSSYVEPRTELEKKLQALWIEVLSLDKISVQDNFFQIGGNSILAIQLIARIRDELCVELLLRDLFEFSTIAKLAQKIDTADLKSDIILPKLTHAPQDREFPLSFSQQRLWFLSLLKPDSVAYNIAGAVHMRGRLKIDVLSKSLKFIIQKHDSFRTIIRQVNGHAVQHIVPLNEFRLDILDINKSTKLDKITQIMNDEAAKPFNLTTGPLFRFKLLRQSPEQYYLFVCVHHIIFDGWSIGILLDELSKLYSAEILGLHKKQSKLKYQYVDYAYWQKNKLNFVINKQLAYWTNKLDGLESLNMPLDKERPFEQQFRGEKEKLMLDEQFLQKLKQLSKDKGLTLFTILLAIFYIILQRYSGQKDLALSVPISGRNLREFENIIGFFVTTLIIRVSIDVNYTFSEFAGIVSKTILEACANSEVPFEKIVSELKIERDLSRNPLVQVAFNYINTFTKEVNMPNLDCDLHTLNHGGAKYDLNFVLIEVNDGLQCEIEYDSALFCKDTIKDLLSRYVVLLKKILFYSEEKIYKISSCENITNNKDYWVTKCIDDSIDLMSVSIINKFKQQVASNPKKIAVKSLYGEITYEGLDYKSDIVAYRIKSLIKTDCPRVCLYLKHDINMIIGILGVLKAGCVYVPININYPKKFVNEIILDSAPELIIVSESTKNAQDFVAKEISCLNVDMLDSKLPTVEKLPEINANTIAYILYTSGSTGRPKGVVQNHENVIRHVNNYIDSLNITSVDGVLQLASYSHDAAVMDMFGSLFSGACLYLIMIRNQEMALISKFIRDNNITVFHSTPTVFRACVSLIPKESMCNITRVVLGGESVYAKDFALFQQYFNSNCTFTNLMGSTECSLALQKQYKYSHEELIRYRMSVGKAVPGVKVVLLDEFDNISELVGELAYKSKNLALGYFNNNEQTKAVFMNIQDSLDYKLYKTGDIARRLPDGGYEILGRKDNQIKIRGFRVEAEHVENVLKKWDKFNDYFSNVAVVAKEDLYLGTYVVAYLQKKKSSFNGYNESDLKEFLSECLPDYMMPQQYIFLDKILVNVHGKIARRVLANLKVVPQKQSNINEPNNIKEKILMNIWREILGNINIGISSNFFELGGHSLLLVILHAKIQEKLDIKFPILELFKYPTIKSFATYLDNLKEKGLASSRDRSLKVMNRKHAMLSRAKRIERSLTGDDGRY